MSMHQFPRLIALLAAMAITALAGCGDDGGGDGASGGGGDGGGTYTLGAVVPSSGPFAEWGRGNRVALKLLEQQINDEGGVNGNQVRFRIHDDSADPAQAANLMRRLASSDQAFAVAGPLTSSAAEVAFPIANSMEIAAVSQASSKPGVAAENRPWAFRNTIDEATLADATLPYWSEEHGIRSAAIIYDSKDAVSTAMGTAIFPEKLGEHGIQAINGDDPISFATGDVDVSAQVTRLKSLNPDGVVIAADYSQAITVLREMARQDFARPVVGGTPLISTAILKAEEEIPIVAPATYYVGIDEPRAREFTESLTAELEKAGLQDLEPTMYDAHIYEIGRMFVEALEQGNVQPGDVEGGRTAIRDYLDQMSDFEGLVGPISFNQDGDAVKTFYVVRGQGGEWNPELRCESSSEGECEPIGS